MANRYAVASRSSATDANADDAVAALHNDHGTKSIYVREIWCFTSAATTMNLGIQRTSTAGTPAVTVTPDADNAFDRHAAPPSGCDLNVGNFTAEPTKQGPYLIRAVSAAQAGAGFVFSFPQPIEVPAGTGLAICTTTAAAFPVADVTFVWDE